MAACMFVKILTVDREMGWQGVETEIAASKEKRQPWDKLKSLPALGQRCRDLWKTLECHRKRFVTLV